MGGVVKSIFGGGDDGGVAAANAEAQRNAQGSALASLIQRDAEANKQVAAAGGGRRRRGNRMLTYLQDETGQTSLN